MKLGIRLVPNARQTGFQGRRDGVPVLKVNAPARDGKANAAAVRYLAEVFGVSLASIRLLSGEKSRQKIFEIISSEVGLSEESLAGRLKKTP